MSTISVVIPVFNGGRFIRRTLDEIRKFQKINSFVDFIIVNDGSTDDTGLILKSEIVSGGKIEFIEYAKNIGKAGAVKLGVSRASGELICFTDADLAYPLEHILRLAHELERVDVAIGNRYLSQNNIPLRRRVASLVFNHVMRFALGFNLLDTQAGVKGFRRAVAKELFDMQKIRSFAFDIELLFLAKKRGFSVSEIPGKLKEDHHEDPTTINLVSDSLRMLLDVIRIKINDAKGIYEKGS